MKIIVCLMLNTLLPAFCIAQPPDTMWVKTYGWSGSESGSWVEQTPDKGYIIAGSSGNDIWLLKTDFLGDTLWTKIYGGYQYEQSGSVQQTGDGGYIVTGGTGSFSSSVDLWILRTDSIGDTLWAKTYGDTGWDYGHALQITNDGNYIVTGWKGIDYAAIDVWLLKIDTLGDTLWTKCYGDSLQDEGWDVKQTTDGGYIITGYTFNDATYSDLWLLKTDSLGDTLWTKRYGGPSSDDGCSVQETSDGGYIITGRTSSFGAGMIDVWLLRTDASGDTLWTKTYGGTDHDRGHCVRIMPDSGYIIFGDTRSYGAGSYDAWLIRTDKDGYVLWQWIYGGTEQDYGWRCRLTSDQGFILLGGTFSFGAGAQDLMLIRLDTEPVGIDEYISGTLDKNQIEVYPNPFTNSINIRLSSPLESSQGSVQVYNVLGRKIKDIPITQESPLSSELSWDGRDDMGNRVPSGIYFLNIYSNAIIITKEIILLR